MTDYATVGTTTPSSGRMLSDMEEVQEEPGVASEEQEEPEAEEEQGVLSALDSPQVYYF